MEHRVYFTNANLVRRGIEYWDTGARHFFYTKEVPEKAVIAMIGRCLRYAGGTSEYWSVAYDRGTHVQVTSPDGTFNRPVWRMDSKNLDELAELIKDDPMEIFIERFTEYNMSNLMKPDQRKFYLNLYEAAENCKATRFTVFGRIYWDMFFRSSLRGCAVTAVSPTPTTGGGNRFARFMPDGGRRYVSPMYVAVREAAKEKAREFGKLYGKKQVSALLVVSVLGFLLAPGYEERVRQIKHKQPFNPLDLLPPGTYKRSEWDHPDYYRKLPHKTWLKNGDAVLCNTCTLKYRCPLYEPGSVCNVPSSEGKALADFFDSRNSEDILTGIQAVLKKQAQRVEGAVEAEEKAHRKAAKNQEPLEYSEQVTKMLNSLQANSERYLKLVDPRYAKPLVQIGQMNLPGAIEPSQPREIDPAQAKRELIELGMPPDAINADHIERYLSGEWNGPREMAELERKSRARPGPIIDAEPAAELPDHFPNDYF